MSGPFGFRDWQRQSGWDSPLLVADNAVNYPGSVTYGPFDARLWDRVAGSFRCNGDTFFQAQWFADQAGTILLAQRIIVYSQPSAADMPFSLPNLGPWCQVSVGIGVAQQVSLHLFMTNRPTPFELIPERTPIIQISGAALPASGIVRPAVLGWYSGPALVWFIATQNANLLLESQTSPGTWQRFDERSNVAANTDIAIMTALPLGSFRATVQNLVAAGGSYWLTVTPAASGG